jgi:hypothetical protein
MRTIPLSSRLGAVLLAFATLAAGSTLVGCAGDDTNPPAPDAGPGDASTDAPKSTDGSSTDAPAATDAPATDSASLTDSASAPDSETDLDSASATDSAGD